ncbi:MAG TPA: hypothetical protein VLM75_04030 [Spirochaetota bacterium]|nr:hypothetical protein [Spirochaetota bacterium]
MKFGNFSVISVIAAILSCCVPAGAQTVTNFDYFGAELLKKGAEHEEYVKPDGTKIFKYPEHEKAVLKDGTVIIRHRDGKREITVPDGRSLIIDFDGTRHYRKPDGSERTISLDGKTPYGEDIAPVEAVVANGGARITVAFDPMLSDDHLDGAGKKFFDELAGSLRAKAGSVKSPGGFECRLVVSQCRFAVTGHCRRKNAQELSVAIFRGSRERVVMRLPYFSMIKDNERRDFAARVAERVFTEQAMTD